MAEWNAYYQNNEEEEEQEEGEQFRGKLVNLFFCHFSCIDYIFSSKWLLFSILIWLHLIPLKHPLNPS